MYCVVEIIFFPYLISNRIMILVSAVLSLVDFELKWHKSVATIYGFYKKQQATLY
jgi:hypothetical protein